MQRLLGQVPNGVKIADENRDQIMLIYDDYERYPSYTKMLYCALDADWLILSSLLWFAFDYYT